MNRIVIALLALLTFADVGLAQSASDLNEGTRLTRDASNGTYTLGWWGRTGRTYFIQQSDDLINWNYVPVIEPGADQVIEWGFTSSADRLFLKLHYSDISTSDPFTADFDGDGLGNYVELQIGLDPLLGDAGGDRDADGFTNAEEYWLGTNLNQAAIADASAAASVGLVVHTDWQ